MVTTRKSTGKLPPPKYADLREDSGVKLEHDDFLHELDEQFSSTAKKRSRKRKADANDDDGGSDYDDKKASQMARRKRLLSARSRNAGKLAKLLAMPVDVISEIAGHLYPQDLLNLARSSKLFRDWLMSKSSRPMWKSARNSIGMPDCPSDLSEPEYASLVFDKDCHVCSAPKVNRIDFPLRVRLCKRCYNEHVIYAFGLIRELSETNDVSDLYTLSPAINGRYYGPAYRPMVQKYLAFEGDTEGRRRFVSERKKLVAEICQHAGSLEIWLRKQQEAKRAIGELKQESRLKSIQDNLLALGYVMEDFEFGHSYEAWELDWRNLVYQPRELTPRIWKNIQSRLEDIIRLRRQAKKQERSRMRKHHVRSYYVSYVEQLHLNAYTKELHDEGRVWLPVPQDAIHFACVQNLLEQWDRTDEEASLQGWNKYVLPLLTEEIHNFQERVKDDCAQILANLRKELDACQEFRRPQRLITQDESDPHAKHVLLKSAAAIFKCPKTNCFAYDAFPAIMNHFHVGGKTYASEAHSHAEAWKPEFVSLSSRMYKTALALLRELGYSTSITFAAMEMKGSRYVCLRCEPPFREKLSWKDLLIHFDKECHYAEKAQDLIPKCFDLGQTIGTTHALCYHDDHHLSLASPLAMEDPEFTQNHGWAVSSEPKHEYQCMQCLRIFHHGRTPSMTVEQLYAHYRSKHPGVECNKEGFCRYPVLQN